MTTPIEITLSNGTAIVSPVSPTLTENPMLTLALPKSLGMDDPHYLLPEEAEALAEQLKLQAAEVRRLHIEQFRRDFDGWEARVENPMGTGDARAGGPPCGTPSLGADIRRAKMLWKYLDEGLKARIRRRYDVNESYDPPIINP